MPTDPNIQAQIDEMLDRMPSWKPSPRRSGAYGGNATALPTLPDGRTPMRYIPVLTADEVQRLVPSVNINEFGTKGRIVTPTASIWGLGNGRYWLLPKNVTFAIETPEENDIYQDALASAGVKRLDVLDPVTVYSNNDPMAGRPAIDPNQKSAVRGNLFGNLWDDISRVASNVYGWIKRGGFGDYNKQDVEYVDADGQRQIARLSKFELESLAFIGSMSLSGLSGITPGMAHTGLHAAPHAVPAGVAAMSLPGLSGMTPGPAGVAALSGTTTSMAAAGPFGVAALLTALVMNPEATENLMGGIVDFAIRARQAGAEAAAALALTAVSTIGNILARGKKKNKKKSAQQQQPQTQPQQPQQPQPQPGATQPPGPTPEPPTPKFKWWKPVIGAATEAAARAYERSDTDSGTREEFNTGGYYKPLSENEELSIDVDVADWGDVAGDKPQILKSLLRNRMLAMGVGDLFTSGIKIGKFNPGAIGRAVGGSFIVGSLAGGALADKVMDYVLPDGVHNYVKPSDLRNAGGDAFIAFSGHDTDDAFLLIPRGKGEAYTDAFMQINTNMFTDPDAPVAIYQLKDNVDGLGAQVGDWVIEIKNSTDPDGPSEIYPIYLSRHDNSTGVTALFQKYARLPVQSSVVPTPASQPASQPAPAPASSNTNVPQPTQPSPSADKPSSNAYTNAYNYAIGAGLSPEDAAAYASANEEQNK